MAKEFKTEEDYSAFVNKMGYNSLNCLERDSRFFIEFHWHNQCVKAISAQWGWQTASAYNSAVVSRWGGARHFGFGHVTGVENCRLVTALHLPSLQLILLSKKKVSATDKKYYPGNDVRQNASDTFCKYHKRFYPKVAAHCSDSCKKKP